MDELIHKELSEDIIGSAKKVLNTLKPGLDEKLYENALGIELTKRGHRVEQQKRFPVHYEGQLIGTPTPDLIVDDLEIVDPKVAAGFTDTHTAQMTGDLASRFCSSLCSSISSSPALIGSASSALNQPNFRMIDRGLHRLRG